MKFSAEAMESNRAVVFLLLLALFLLSSTAELESSSKKRGDITQKSNSNEETEEEVAIEDMENAFEQLRELSALRDTILKLVPASDPIYEKIGKQAGRKEDGEAKAESASKEPLENPGTRNVWMKTMIAQTKDTDTLVINERPLDEEDMESWEAQELYDTLEEEIQEPLSVEQQAGMSYTLSLNGVMTLHKCYFFTIFPFSRAVVQESRKYHKYDARQQTRGL